MSRRLRPVRTQRRVRFRLTIPTLLLPVLAFVLLARGSVVRAPLGEREAGLATSAQSSRSHPAPAAPEEGDPRWTAAAVALVSAAPSLLGGDERHLRLPGLLAGSAALGVAVVLGERLFATRVGLLAALLLLALPGGRPLLGSELGGAPYFLLAMLAALTAIRDMDEARIAAVFAGVGSGLAIAIGGPDGLWLPALALAWLWLNQGLTLRSLTVVASSTTVTLACTVLAARLWLARSGVRLVLFSPPLLTAQLVGAADSPAALGRTLLPLLPFVVLGIAARPRGWASDPSLRFVALWLAFGAAAFLATGSPAAAYVALLYAIAMLVVWGLESSGRRAALIALVVTIAIGAATYRGSGAARTRRALDRWAAREAGGFVWRTIPPERRVAAASGARHRLAFYARRPVEALALDPPGFGDAEYLVLRLTDFRSTLRAARRAQAREGVHRAAPPLRMLAQFGPWVIAKVLRPTPSGPAEPPLDSSSVRPPDADVP